MDGLEGIKIRRMKRRRKRRLLFAMVVLISVLGGLYFLRDSKRNIIISESQVINGVDYLVDTIPPSNKRSQATLNLKYIVVHNTANPNSTARNERNYLSNPVNTSGTSWHIVVDELGAIEAIPLNEEANHAGDRVGNSQGIGIEICESGDYEKTEENAIKIIAYLIYHSNLTLDSVKTHKDFSGKDCPRLILSRWDEFTDKILLELVRLENQG